MLLLRNLPLTGEKFPYDGPAMVSTGSQVKKWTVRQCRSRQDWGNPVADTKQVNANANTFEYAEVNFSFEDELLAA